MGRGGEANRVQHGSKKISMEEIIPPVHKELIKKELTRERFLRHTNNGNNHVYLVNHHNAPNVVREIGRLREITFRDAGGGTGLSIDLDENDTCERCYDQLIAWSTENEEIIAGYRLIRCDFAGQTEDGTPNLSTAHLFEFSEQFVNDYLPYTIELGRSFVQPKYQPINNNRKGIFSLDNLWDGLGAVVALNPDIKYLFGKVTMYTHYNQEARDLLLGFMQYYFPDKDQLVRPIPSIALHSNYNRYISEFEGMEYKDGYKLLTQKIKGLGEIVPPLINIYMNLSATMKTFGTAINNEFGEVEETGILLTLEDIYPTKKIRYIGSYERDKDWER
jgi:hypothetical protein